MQNPEVKVLIEGYVRGTKVVPTTTLIRDGKTNIVVDPGMGADKEKVLAAALKKEGLRFDDIKTVFCTHYHIDHTQHVGLFKKARIVDWKYVYRNNDWSDHAGDGYKISPNVSIVHTPGHTIEHASLIVKTKDRITFVVAGDLWWFSDMGPKMDDMAWNQKILEKSRAKILKLADFIIPGHGKMFKARMTR